MTDTSVAEQPPASGRTFLIVVDDSAEMRVALRFACGRARKTGGHIAMLRVVEPAEFQHWAAVGDIMREEARAEAEQLMRGLADEVNELSGKIPSIYIREGDPREELLKLLEEEDSISIVVLGSGTGKEGPGPIISHLLSKGRSRLTVPVTIVPGGLTDAQVDGVV